MIDSMCGASLGRMKLKLSLCEKAGDAIGDDADCVKMIMRAIKLGSQ